MYVLVWYKSEVLLVLLLVLLKTSRVVTSDFWRMTEVKGPLFCDTKHARASSRTSEKNTDKEKKRPKPARLSGLCSLAGERRNKEKKKQEKEEREKKGVERGTGRKKKNCEGNRKGVAHRLALCLFVYLQMTSSWCQP